MARNAGSSPPPVGMVITTPEGQEHVFGDGELKAMLAVVRRAKRSAYTSDSCSPKIPNPTQPAAPQGRHSPSTQ